MSSPLPSDLRRYWPTSIKLFAIAYSAWIVFSLSNSMLIFETLRQTVTDLVDATQPVEDYAVYSLLVARIVIELLLLAAVLKWQSRFAALVIGVQVIGRILGSPAGIRAILEGYYQAGIYLIGVVLLCLAATCLLTSSSRRWFALKGRIAEIDVQDFS